MFTSMRSAARNMSGYLSGLSSPSVTDRMTTLCASPRSNAAGQTRLPTFSISSRRAVGRRQRVERVAHHVRVEVAALARVHLHGGGAGGADAVGVERRLLVALDHAHRESTLERLDRAHQQRRLARARARHEVQREDAAIGERPPVPVGVGIVPGEDVLLDPDDALGGHARVVHGAERAGSVGLVDGRAVVDVAVPRAVGMRGAHARRPLARSTPPSCRCQCVWTVPSSWRCSWPCSPRLSTIDAVDSRFAVAATACRAHVRSLRSGPSAAPRGQAMAISLTRISSPARTCNW